MKINDILRASGVDRWHIVRTIRNQSLAEHTFDVVMIARAIAKIAELDDYEIIKAALLHDLDEIVTGDIPTPTKARARENGWDLNTLYKDITGRELTKDESDVVKLADKLADLHFLNEHGLGHHAEVVFDTMADEWNKLIGPGPSSYNPVILEAARTVSLEMRSGDFTI